MEKQHSEELRALYRSPNILRVIKSRRLRWGDPTETDHVEHLRVHGRIILKFIFKRWNGAPAPR
jgi:hypothetical protein